MFSFKESCWTLLEYFGLIKRNWNTKKKSSLKNSECLLIKTMTRLIPILKKFWTTLEISSKKLRKNTRRTLKLSLLLSITSTKKNNFTRLFKIKIQKLGLKQLMNISRNGKKSWRLTLLTRSSMIHEESRKLNTPKLLAPFVC